MSVVGRLWRRAPAFRVCLMVALASTALAAMFPPHPPAFVSKLHGRAPDQQAHFTPPPAAAPLDYSSIDLPPIETQRSRLIPFAGRQLPLPAGKWAEVALLRSGGPFAVQALVLTRLQSSRLTGMIIVTGTPPVEPASLHVQPVNQCVDASDPVLQDPAPTLHRDLAMRDCWSVSPLPAAALTDATSQNMLLKRSLDRLRALGVTLPAALSAAYYVRAGDDGGMTMRIMLAGPATSGAARDRRTQSWMQRWVPLLRQGFDGSLRPADVTPQAARDPAADSDPS